MAGATPRQSQLLNTSGEYARTITISPNIIKNQHPLGTIYQAPNNCIATYTTAHGPLGRNIVNGFYATQHYAGNDFTKINTNTGSAVITTYPYNDCAVALKNTGSIWLGNQTPFTFVMSLFVPTTRVNTFSCCSSNTSNGELHFYISHTSNTIYAVSWNGSTELTTNLGTIPTGNILVAIEVTYVSANTYRLALYCNGKLIGSSNITWVFNSYSSLGPRQYAYPNHSIFNIGLVYGLWIMKGKVGAVSTAEPWSQTLSYKTKANNNWVPWG